MCKFSFFFKNSHFLENFRKREPKNLRNKKQDFQKKMKISEFSKNERNNFKPVRKIIFVEFFLFLANFLETTKRNTETIFGTCFDSFYKNFQKNQKFSKKSKIYSEISFFFGEYSKGVIISRHSSSLTSKLISYFCSFGVRFFLRSSRILSSGIKEKNTKFQITLKNF